MTAAVQTMQLPPTPTNILLPRVPKASAGAVPSLSNSLSSTPESDDQLKELRVSFPRRPLPTPPTAVQQQQQQRKPLPVPRTHTAPPDHVPSPISPNHTQGRPAGRSSFYAHMRSTSLATISAKPEILARLLDHLSWSDFYGLYSASRTLRRIFLDPNIKDVVFGHFVPGYRRALSLRDKRVWEDTIRMDYTDLGLLMLSMETPLHRYPMHAISMLSSNTNEPSTSAHSEATKHLQSLSQVHSRAVLLLQNMVHSTTQPVAPELEDPRWKTSTLSPSSSMRELTFPAPLSYFDPHSSSGDGRTSQSRSPSEDTRTSSPSEEARKPGTSPSRSATTTKTKLPKAKFDLKPIVRSVARPKPGEGKGQGHGRKWGSESNASPAYGTNSFGAIGAGGRAAAARGFTTRSASAGPSSWKPAVDPQPPLRRGSRLSIFGGPASPLPPPAPEPDSMRIYSGSWRRTTRSAQALPSALATASDDEAILKPPNRRFLGSSNLSSQSSLNSSPTQSSGGSGGHSAATPSSSSPHDLVAATSRTRAPILRVFVPCSSLSEEVIAVCEDQLIDDGLWDHLSVGDVVCNFGYVPPIEETEETQSPEKDHRRWLVYNGDRLLIYFPNQAPPIPDPLSLPSPFYYSHILPPQLNPRLRLTLPPFRASYTLAPLTNTISITPSPSVSPSASPRLGMGASGLVRVKTYAWLATLDAHVDPRLVEEGWMMNEGWAGEWVLQGEGTREGRVALQESLMRRPDNSAPRMEREYEIVLDKSGSGRLWLRMLDSTPHAHHQDNTNSLQLRTS